MSSRVGNWSSSAHDGTVLRSRWRAPGSCRPPCGPGRPGARAPRHRCARRRCRCRRARTGREPGCSSGRAPGSVPGRRAPSSDTPLDGPTPVGSPALDRSDAVTVLRPPPATTTTVTTGRRPPPGIPTLHVRATIRPARVHPRGPHWCGAARGGQMVDRRTFLRATGLMGTASVLGAVRAAGRPGPGRHRPRVPPELRARRIDPGPARQRGADRPRRHPDDGEPLLRPLPGLARPRRRLPGAGRAQLRLDVPHRRRVEPAVGRPRRQRRRHVPPAVRRHARPVAGLRLRGPRPQLVGRTRPARPRLPRRGQQQRPLRARLLRGRRPAVHLTAGPALHHLRPLPLLAAQLDAVQPPLPAQRPVGRLQLQLHPAEGGRVQVRHDLGPPAPGPGAGAQLLLGPAQPGVLGLAPERHVDADRPVLRRLPCVDGCRR